MAKTAMVQVRIEPELKIDVERIFGSLGMNTAEAINIFFKHVKLNRGIPFEIKIPNSITNKTFKDTDHGKNLVKSKNAKAMFKKLGL